MLEALSVACTGKEIVEQKHEFPKEIEQKYSFAAANKILQFSLSNVVSFNLSKFNLCYKYGYNIQHSQEYVIG